LEDDPDVHCTVGKTFFDSPPFEPGKASRIDYIFRKGFGGTSFAEVFFNPEAFPSGLELPVSDHSAVLTQIPLSAP
jgi:hypothetical protein